MTADAPQWGQDALARVAAPTPGRQSSEQILANLHRPLCVECMLDGRPAIICGACNPFATVAQYPAGLAVDFAWQTVAHVLASGGSFTS